MGKIAAAIIIPARYGSTRFEGKPLALLAGQPMLYHVYKRAEMAKRAILKQHENVEITIIVATDDTRIAALCTEKNMAFVMTSSACRTGSDRVCEALRALNLQHAKTNGASIDIVLNLQGDNPFASETAIAGVLLDLIENEDHDVATPVLPLDWSALDSLRMQKQSAPFSGTTVTINDMGRALWFSKNIIPALRKEDTYRRDSDTSPVYRHIGLYGYKRTALERFVTLPESVYEALEGLEQLRFLENDIAIYTVKISKDDMPPISGIDSREDIAHAHDLIEKNMIKLPDFKRE